MKNEDIDKHMNIDFHYLFMAIHFETAAKLQLLSKDRYEELRVILDLENPNEEVTSEQAKRLRQYLSDDFNLKKFQEIFPVIITTNLSSIYLGSINPQFDIVMMDEAGQANIANALLPICRAKQLLLVGDPQQLRPIILLDKGVNDKLRQKYHISDEYDYVENSIYTAYTSIDIVNNESLLSYHYRCNERIIQFSNRKYYHNKLKIMSKSIEPKPLEFYDTDKADTERSQLKNTSEVEAREICNYIKKHPDQNIGVITPFVHQKECIESYLDRNNIKDVTVGTVHAFQGDQKDVIIFSTAISKQTKQKTYQWLKCNK